MSLLNLDDVVARVFRRLKSGNDSGPYEAIDVHDAILSVGNDFVQSTRCIRAKSQVAISEDQFAIDFSGVSGFLPPLIIDACTKAGRDGSAVPVVVGDAVSSITVTDGGTYDADNPPTATVTGGTGATLVVHMTGNTISSITKSAGGSGYASDSTVTITRDPADAAKEYTLDLPDLGTVRDIRTWCDNSSGKPTRMCFTTLTDALFDRPVDFDGCVQIIWTPNFSSFLPGVASNPELNLPAELLIPCIDWIACIVESNKLEAVERDRREARYKQHVTRSMGAGGLGAKVLVRDTADTIRRGR